MHLFYLLFLGWGLDKRFSTFNMCQSTSSCMLEFFYRIRHHFCYGHYIAHINVLHVSVIFTAHQGGVLEFSDVCKHYLGRLGEVAAVLFSVVCLLGGAIVYWVLMSNFLYNTVSFIYSECITNNLHISVLQIQQVFDAYNLVLTVRVTKWPRVCLCCVIIHPMQQHLRPSQ